MSNEFLLSQADFDSAIQRADLLFDRTTLESSIAVVAARIDNDLAGQQPILLGVMNGGQFFASLLALAMRTDVQMDYCHATRYRGDTEGGDLHWVAKPRNPLHGRTVLVCDDILDEGYTLAEIVRFAKEQGAASVKLATLCEKRHDRRVPDLFADYVCVQVPDRYVFGFGMDFHEHGRNLPGIYAV